VISVRSDMRGHPGATTRVATVDTPKEAIDVVKALRRHGITASWKPHPPYVVRTSFQDARRAIEHLERLVGLWSAIENGEVYTEADHQRFRDEHELV